MVGKKNEGSLGASASLLRSVCILFRTKLGDCPCGFVLQSLYTNPRRSEICGPPVLLLCDDFPLLLQSIRAINLTASVTRQHHKPDCLLRCALKASSSCSQSSMYFGPTGLSSAQHLLILALCSSQSPLCSVRPLLADSPKDYEISLNRLYTAKGSSPSFSFSAKLVLPRGVKVIGEFVCPSSTSSTLLSFSSLSRVGMSLELISSTSSISWLCAMLLPSLKLAKLSLFLDAFLCMAKTPGYPWRCLLSECNLQGSQGHCKFRHYLRSSSPKRSEVKVLATEPNVDYFLVFYRYEISMLNGLPLSPDSPIVALTNSGVLGWLDTLRS
eukprot:Gb_19485 [translate_table: standard]